MADLSMGDLQEPVSYKLVYWVVCSIMLHLLLLLYLEQPDTTFTLPTGQATLHVTLEAHNPADSRPLPQRLLNAMEPVQPARPKESLPASKATLEKVVDEGSRESPVQMQQVASQSAPLLMGMEELTSIEHNALENTHTPSPQRNEIESQLKQELARHFSYPHLARRRGWQGEVTISFTLETDGRIHDIRIANSSGNSVLDKAALLSVSKVERIKLTPPHPLTFELPVIYKLS